MSLPSFCIKRPVFTVMLTVLPIALGLLSLRSIGVELFPNVELPLVIVTTTRPGSAVEEMETGVTKVIEEAVNTIAGVDELSSTTSEGLSVVLVSFELKKHRDIAFQEVQSKISTVLPRLPEGTETPVLDKFDVDATPILTLAVSGSRSLRDLTDIAQHRIADGLSSVSGVGTVTIVGGERRAIHVTVDAGKLAAFGLTIAEVEAALRGQNLEIPGGQVAQGERELILRTMGRIPTPAGFADIIVANRGGQPIRIRDLGGTDVVTDSHQEERSLARLDLRRAVTLVVQKQGGTNTVEAIDAIKGQLQVISDALAQEGFADIDILVIRDQSVFIKGSLHEVEVHIVLGALLVMLTILLFLRDWRTTIIAGLAIPISVVATFPVLAVFGLTLNNITLIGLVLIIGIVIDDAVIVIENIFRWMEDDGLPPMQAALKGTQEIAPAVLATTLSLAVIFLPIAFMQGTVGMFLRSFGITCAAAVLVSMLVSFTLTPMLSSRFLRAPKKRAAARRTLFETLVEAPYLYSLRVAMRHRALTMLLTLAVSISPFPLPIGRWTGLGPEFDYPGLLQLVGFSFIPKDDQSEMEISFTTPQGWSLERVSTAARVLEERLLDMPEVTHVLSQIGDTSGRSGSSSSAAVTRGSIYVRLIELAERRPKFSQFAVMDRAREMLRDYPDLRASVEIPAAISRGGDKNADLEFLLTGPDLVRLDDYAKALVVSLARVDGLVDVDSSLSPGKPEVRVVVDRERASDLGVSLGAVAGALRTLVGGQIVSQYKDSERGEQYDVWLRARAADRSDPQGLAMLRVPSTKLGSVQLSNLARPIEGLGPAEIDRAQRQRKISIYANLRGLSTNAGVAAFNKAFAELQAPGTYTLLPGSRAKNQAEAMVAFVLAFGFSLLFMYMILAAQFESFFLPISILLALPVTIPFALISLAAMGEPLTLFSVLGLFLLFGIVKKNGILQIDYTNVLRARLAAGRITLPAPFNGDATGRQGWDRWAASLPPPQRARLWAILEANRVRLRPILMTTIMLITAMVPIALGTGPGSANRADMARVIVGGQALSLLLSLLVTPVSYSLLDRAKRGRT